MKDKSIFNFLYWLSLGLLFSIFVFLHFYRLSLQQFMGDEASPMLLIDRMWDAFRLHDFRFLFYPFLWYQDPYRAPFSGTILHLFGPDRVLTRLPNILFDFGTFGLLFYIFRKEKVPLALHVLLLAVFSTASQVFIARLAGGDAQFRFFFLLAGYLSYTVYRTGVPRHYLLALLSFAVSLLTMLNALVLAPFGLFILFQKKLHQNRTVLFMTILSGVLFVLYFFAWLALPYLAYKTGFQDQYADRGLWYYIHRASEPKTDWTKSIRALCAYSSLPFALLLLLTLPLTFFFKEDHFLLLLTFPAWLSVFILSRPSLHIVMFIPLFFLHTSIIVEKIWMRFPFAHILVVCVLIAVTGANVLRIANGFFLEKNPEKEEFWLGHLTVPRPGGHIDEAVQRIYDDHK